MYWMVIKAKAERRKRESLSEAYYRYEVLRSAVVYSEWQKKHEKRHTKSRKVDTVIALTFGTNNVIAYEYG